MTAYTPGPWAFDDVWALIRGPNGEEVAVVHSSQADGERLDREVADANACLITAAPELYGALRALCDFLHTFPESLNAAPASDRAHMGHAYIALARAEGRGA